MNMGNTPEFTHLDESGNAHMVDVTAKNATARRAVARCTVTMKPETAAAISGKEDHLLGLKENVIVGHLIPAGTGVREYQKMLVGSKAEMAEMVEASEVE